MRVLGLSLRNFRVFEEVDLELPARVIGIFGNNGSGKTSLVESVLYALYGRARTDKKEIRTHGVLTDCAVRLAFEHAGGQYEVRRTIRGKNHQTDAELYLGDLQLAAGVTEVDEEIRRLLHMDHQVFRASVFAEQKQLDAFSDVTKGKRKEMVLRLLGIRPVDDARAAAKREARDAKQNAERLAGTLPDLSEQEAAVEAVRAEAGEARARANRSASDLKDAQARAETAEKGFERADGVRERAEQIAIERNVAEDRATELDASRRQLEERIADIGRDLEGLPALEAEHAGLADAPKRLAAGEKASEAAGEVAALESDLEAVPEVDAAEALAELERAQQEARAAQRASARADGARDRAGEELASAQKALERAGEADPSQPCPTCGRPLGEDFRQYVAHARQQVRDRKAAAQEATRGARAAASDLKAAESRLREAGKLGEAARKASEARSRLEEDLRKARGRLEHLTEPFEGRVPDLEELAAAANRAAELGTRVTELRNERKHLARTRADLQEAAASLKRARARIDELDREAAALAFDPEDHARLRKERDEAATLLEQARGAERQAATLLSQAERELSRLEGGLAQARETAARVGDLREEARYAGRVSDLLDGFRDHLVSRIGPELSREAEAVFRDLTNHEYEDLKIDEETLAIRIADGTDYFEIERFSGSEADLANLALRVAISMHLSRMSGADVGMMVLDEVLGTLDAERKDLMVQTLGRLEDRFNQLFVITHAEQVKDQFPAQVEVRKVGRRRSIAELR